MDQLGRAFRRGLSGSIYQRPTLFGAGRYSREQLQTKLWDVEARIAQLKEELGKRSSPRPDVFIVGVTDQVNPKEAELSRLQKERAALRAELGLPEFEAVLNSAAR